MGGWNLGVTLGGWNLWFKGGIGASPWEVGNLWLSAREWGVALGGWNLRVQSGEWGVTLGGRNLSGSKWERGVQSGVGVGLGRRNLWFKGGGEWDVNLGGASEPMSNFL